MSDVRIFVSFDSHDGDLPDLLAEHAARPSAGFEICARSEPGPVNGRWESSARVRMAGADAVVVICGEHTEDSLSVDLELRIAQEQNKPYLLLWGRRESMCTRPGSARAADGMYSWTWEILRSQLAAALRNAQPRVIPESCKRRDAAG